MTHNVFHYIDSGVVSRLKTGAAIKELNVITGSKGW